MSRVKAFFQEKPFFRYSLFIAFNAALLYALYFIIKNFDFITMTAAHAASGFFSALTPLFVGLVLAYLLSPMVELIDKKIMSRFFFKMPADPLKKDRRQNLKRFISILITFVILLGAICLIIYAFAVLIMGQFVFTGISQMITSIVDYFLTYQDIIREWATNLPSGVFADKVQGIVDVVVNWFYAHFSAEAIVDFIAGIGGSILNLALGAIVSIYLLKDRHFFKGLWRKFLHLLLPQKANAIVTETLSDISNVLSQFIRGALLDSLIIAILSSIGLSLLGLDFAVFIGCFAGIANVIPYFGPVLGMIPAFLVGTFTDGILNGIAAVVILLFIQQIDCNIIYPKIVGSTTGLHPLFVLLAVSVAGYYGGILGMILAVPIAGILQVFVVKWIRRMDEKEAARLELAAAGIDAAGGKDSTAAPE